MKKSSSHSFKNIFPPTKLFENFILPFKKKSGRG